MKRRVGPLDTFWLHIHDQSGRISEIHVRATSQLLHTLQWLLHIWDRSFRTAVTVDDISAGAAVNKRAWSKTHLSQGWDGPVSVPYSSYAELSSTSGQPWQRLTLLNLKEFKSYWLWGKPMYSARVILLGSWWALTETKEIMYTVLTDLDLKSGTLSWHQ